MFASNKNLTVLLALLLTAACGAPYFPAPTRLVVADGGQVELPIGPYLRYQDSGRYLLGMQLPRSAKARVQYWVAEFPEDMAEVPVKPAFDSFAYASLEAVEPGVETHYRVVVGSQSLEEHVLSSPPLPDESFSFLVVGDTRRGGDALHTRLVEQMAQHDAVFYIHLGDFVRHGDHVEDWRAFFAFEQPLLERMPILPVVGNHDYADSGLYEGLFLLDRFDSRSRRYYEARFGAITVLVLDSTSPVEEGDTQYRWVEERLLAARVDGLRHVFVAIHNPFYSSGKHGCAPAAREKGLLPLLEKHGVRAVFAGHDHHYERTEPVNGITHIVSGGGGAELSRVDQASFCAKAIITNHFLKITVEGHRATLQVFDLQGELIDEAKL